MRSSKETSAYSVALDRPSTFSITSPMATSRLGKTWSTGRPTIMRTSCGSVTEETGPSPTFSPSRRQTKSSAMRKISSNLWLMKTMARPSAFSCADDAEQVVDLVGRQGGGRLVHDDDLRLVRQSARDLDEVLLGDGQALQRHFRRDVGVDALEQRARRARASSAQSTSPPAPVGMWPMKMFSATESSSNITVSWWIAAMPAAQESRGEEKTPQLARRHGSRLRRAGRCRSAS